MTVPSNWYENFFHGVPLELWRKAVSPQQTNAEADFLFKTLDCKEGAHVLDVPCGNGRLSFALAERGCRATGVDLSAEFIQEAQARRLTLSMDNPQLSTDNLLQQVEFVHDDMKSLQGESIYDGAFCLGNSFGYLAHADTQTFLSGVCRALKPGAHFVLETGMAAESILPKLEERAWYQIEDILMTIEHRYVAAESCIDATYTFIRDGKSDARDAKYWIYTVAEIRRMLAGAGFVVLDLFGSTDQRPYELGSGDLFLLAEKS